MMKSGTVNHLVREIDGDYPGGTLGSHLRKLPLAASDVKAESGIFRNMFYQSLEIAVVMVPYGLVLKFSDFIEIGFDNIIIFHKHYNLLIGKIDRACRSRVFRQYTAEY